MPITGTTGNDILDGTSGADEIFGLAGNDTINALDGNDTIYGGLGNDTMNGGDGDDLFIQDDSSSFADVFNGGAGTDTIELRVVANPIVTQFGLLSSHFLGGANALSSIERLDFASQTGSAVMGVLQLGAVAASGLTEVEAGGGRDILVLLAGQGAGSFTIPTLNYTGFSSVGTNSWENLADSDVLILVSSATAGSVVTLNAANGLAVAQALVGGAGNDTLNGSANADFLDGAGGTNQLNGNGGNDSLAIVNQYSPNNAGGFLPVNQFTGAGSTLDGGAGTDVLNIGGLVVLEATLVSIEGVVLQAAFVPPVANTAKQDAAVLVLDAAHIAMLPTNAFFTGSGTVIFEPGANQSLDLSTYVLTPGHSLEFLLFANDGNALTFTGSAAGDQIFLGIGNQTAIGGAGDDRIYFGVGNQVGTGGAGADRFGPGQTNGIVTDFTLGVDKVDLSDSEIYNLSRLYDLLSESAGNAVISATTTEGYYQMTLQGVSLASLSPGDFLLGNAVSGNDFDSGTAAAEMMFGGDGNDEYHGGGGNDRLYGGGGTNLLFGDDGDDTFILDTEVPFGGTFNGGTGTDTLLLRNFYDNNPIGPFGPASTYLLFGTGQASITGIERMQFDSDAGSAVSGVILAPLLAGSGLTELIGGDGTDSLVALVTAGGSYTLANYTLTNWTGEDALILFTNAPVTADVTLTASTLAVKHVLIGAGGNDTLTGAGGFDTLDGAGGNDMLDGRGGSDRMFGGTGNDTFFVDTQADLIFENVAAGVDVAIANTSFYLYANVEGLTLAAGAGNLFGVGNELGNTLTGNEGVNLLLGGAGDDIVNGGAGNDVLYGEDGGDVVSGDGGIDFVAGGLGNDELFGNAGADALFGEDGDDYLDGGTSFDTDILVGGAGNDTLYAISGQVDPEQDLLDGGAGDDTYWVDTGVDLTFEAIGGGTDTVHANVTVPNAGVYLYANVENLVLEGTTAFGVGNELNNVLTGSDSGNWLLGGAGNDRIDAGGGNDVLFGEAGADTFVFGANEGADLIGDFAIAEDVIEFAGIFTSFAQVQANMVQVGADMAIDLGGGNLMVLLGIDKLALTAANFSFTAAAAPLAAAKAAPVMEAFASAHDALGGTDFAGRDHWQNEFHQQMLIA